MKLEKYLKRYEQKTSAKSVTVFNITYLKRAVVIYNNIRQQI